MSYHKTVLLNEAVEQLITDVNGVYVDATFGGGGHSKLILDKLSKKGKLFAFDKDKDAIKNKINDKRFYLINQDFRYMKYFLFEKNITKVNGILADLGISSHQIDSPNRGFSYKKESKLDMRMNISNKLSAYEVVNKYPLKELIRIFKEYGEIEKADKLAKEIILNRKKEIKNTTDLVSVLEKFIPKKKKNKFLSKIFQAIRIEVNDELSSLMELLNQSKELIIEGGRMVIISYHSLEDRIVKRFIKSGNFSGKIEKDLYGNILRPFVQVNKKVIVPSIEEIKNNKRARSAKMRVAKKI